jgi:hypothetical protein
MVLYGAFLAAEGLYMASIIPWTVLIILISER